VTEPREVVAPYPGLRPFESHEGAIFFGREEHTGRLLEILHREHFVAVVGPSGSGKSSLVRAGMLPALTAGWMGGGSDWRIAIVKPGDRPMQQLARALVGPAALGAELLPDMPPGEPLDRGATAPIEAELRRGPLGLVQLVDEARRLSKRAHPSDLLVLVDQFEEIFRYASAGRPEADESDAFVDLLLESRTNRQSRIHVALTMRSDFLGNCVDFQELPEAINRGQYLTPRLTREQLFAAITRPAELFHGRVEPELVNDLINAVSRDPDQLPILQHALARMWEHAVASSPHAPVMTRAVLEATGGITGALGRHADSVLDSLGGDAAVLAELLFRAVTERAGEAARRDIRRPQKLQDIAVATGREWRVYLPVVEAFANEGVNFLTYVRPLDADSTIDISHEALIRQWPRLQRWVAEEFERGSEYRRWRDRALDWTRGGELLVGADLAHARDWLSGGRSGQQPVEPDATTAPSWKPTAAWGARYAHGGVADAREEFERTTKFIEESRAREREQREAAERIETERRERERRQLEAEARAAEARAEAEHQRAQADREQARLAQKRVRDLERVIKEIPDEKRREALAKRYLPQSIKHLSKRQQKTLATALKAGPLSTRARARVPPEFGLKLWENGATLRVRLMGGTSKEHDAVRKAVAEWMKYANLTFVFDSAADAEVRVAFKPEDGSWSFVGTDSLALSTAEPTMNLGWVGENVLHEFGHVLGLIHETSNPNANLVWNKQAVYRDLGGPPNYWSKEQIDAVMFTKEEKVTYRPFDGSSIMAYSFPGSWFRDGRAIKGGTTLSASDKEFIQTLYPGRAKASSRPKARRKRGLIRTG
jgi:hypothetical protein